MTASDTIGARLLRRANARPDAVFSVFHARGETETITFGRVLERSLRYTAVYAKYGIKRGDIVVVSLKHSPHLFYGFLGALLAGAIPSFMPFPSSKQNPVHYWRDHGILFDRIEPAAILTYAENAQALAEHLPRFSARTIIASDALFADVTPADAALLDRADADDIACLQHSSGTTSLKKGVMLTHRAIIAAIESYAESIGLTQGDCIASWLPLYHDMGFIACFMTSVVLGTRLAALDPFEWVVRPTSLLDALERNRASFCWLPNFAFSHIVNAARPQAHWDLSGVRAFINCSEPCKPATFERFLNRFSGSGVRPESLHVSYAMAENVFGVTQTALDRPARTMRCDADAFASGRIEPAQPERLWTTHLSCGKPIAGVRVQITDEGGQTLPDGTIGEIRIASDFLFSGYHHLPEITKKRLRNGWYHTGDLGFFLDGELYVTGRLDDMLVLNGRNYYAHEIEAIVNDVPEVLPGRTVALTIDDQRTDSAVAVVLAETRSEPDARTFGKAVRQAVQERLGLALHDVVSLTAGSLVKTTSGKISRSENKALYLSKTP